MSMRVLLVGLSLLVVTVTGQSFAPPLLYKVASGQSVELTLRGYDASGKKLIAEITQLPSRGTLHDLSQSYSRYKHTQHLFNDASISATPHMIPEVSGNRIFYKAPESNYPIGEEWTQLKYVVKTEGGLRSSEGIIRIIPAERSELIIRSSEFNSNTDGWKIVDNGPSSIVPSYETSSFGPSMNRFIHSTDAVIKLDKDGRDQKLWKFSAPQKFLGNQLAVYKGYLKFSLAGFSGDFKNKKADVANDMVILECRSCSFGRGLRMASTFQFDGTPGEISIPMLESAWKKDPKNTLNAWTAPTACEMVELLDNLSAMYILGDHSTWYESVGLDNVRFVAQDVGSKSPVPVNCLCTSPGSKCF